MYSICTAEDARLRANLADLRLLLNTPAKKLIAAFLHAHPYTYDHATGLSQRFSLSPEKTAAALDELTNAGVLVRLGQGANALYALNSRDGWLDVLGTFFTEHSHAPRLLARIFSAII